MVTAEQPLGTKRSTVCTTGPWKGV